MEITLDLPDYLIETLKRKADAHRRGLSDEIRQELEILLPLPDDDGREGLHDEDSFIKQLQAEGVLAKDEDKLGPELALMAQDIPEEEFEILRELLSRGKPLSEIIIEDRR